MPMARVRSISPRIGGGFGGKGGPNLQPAAALLALKTGKPVKIALNRTEDFETTRCRHPARIRIKTGARRDGTLVAREVDVTLDGGAYTDESPAVLTFALLMARGPYNVPHVRARGRVVYTNKLKSSAFRGFGNPQVTFAGEQQVEEIARRLGLDPVDIRLKNAIKPGERWIGGQTVPSCALARCLEAVRDAAVPSPTPVPAGRKRGIGYTSVTHVSGLLSTGANVLLESDGSVALSVGAVDLGQGSDTILTQVCAEALKLPVDRVSFATPDTDSSPYNWKTAASRVTYMCGRAVLAASEAVREQILREASEMLECAAGDLELRPGGRVGLRGVPGKELGFGDISGRRLYRTGGQIAAQHTFNFDGEPLDPKRATVSGFAFPNLGVYTFGAQAVEVEVDTATGAVKVLKAWAAHDVGRAINPTLVEGQIHGGFVQGLGYALSEEMVWDGGRLANPSFMDYKMPGILDAPPEIVPIILEDPEPTGPYGAKGVGEICLVGVAAAVANAVAAATGARLRRLPLTPETVLDALERPSERS
jgi:CO/xanthine dehydrogenase Mo-binding subunit